MIIFKKQVSSQTETIQLIKIIINHLEILNDKVFLIGLLGAGKTFVIREILQQLGVDEIVASPTFNLINHYEIDTASKKNHPVIHADLYRLQSSKEVEELGLIESLEKPGLSFIEWGEKFPDLFSFATKIIKLEIIDESNRKITLINPSSHND